MRSSSRCPLVIMCFLAMWSLAQPGCGSKDEPTTAGPTAEQVEADIEESAKAEAMRRAAEESAANAMREAEAARKTVDELAEKLAELDAGVSKAVDAVVAAPSDRARASAKEKLVELQREKAALEVKIAEAKAVAARAERMIGVKISKECLKNPLAKGCS